MALASDMKYYRKLFRKASRGNKAALNELSAANDIIAKQVNKNLRQLERKGFDYGAAYNNAQYFTNSEYNSKRFQLSKKLNYDEIDMLTQIEQGIKFLNYKSSTVEGQQEILDKKTERFIELEIFPEDISKRTAKSFIKFLGNEETKEVAEEYGMSGVALEMLYDAFQKRGNTKDSLKRAFIEFLARRNTRNRQTFDELMQQIGINVYQTKYTTQKRIKGK